MTTNDPEYMRRWREANRARTRETARRYRAAHPDATHEMWKRASARWRDSNRVKSHAHDAVNNAIKAGRLAPQGCEECGAKAEAHHDDYSKPLEVRWLCRLHHNELHKKRA